jgi:hypothetical protein
VQEDYMSRVAKRRRRTVSLDIPAGAAELATYLDLRRQWLYASGTRRAIFSRHAEGCATCHGSKVTSSVVAGCYTGARMAGAVLDAAGQLAKIDAEIRLWQPPPPPPVTVPSPATLY